jgi:signal transduction histidine kinase
MTDPTPPRLDVRLLAGRRLDPVPECYGRHVTRPRLAWIESGSRLECLWVAFALLNLAAMLVIIELRYGQGWETVPFHFIYVSFTILYGFRAWRGRATLLGILFVTLTTGAATAYGIFRNWEDPPELTEVPLMSLMFVAMVYHVRRRQQAQAVAEALASEREGDVARKSAFLSDAAHELLTPITIGRGHLELLRRTPRAGADELEATHEIVLGELGRMERVINRLLLLESAGGGAPGRRERVDMAALMTRTFQRWQGTADRDWRMGELPRTAVAADADQVTLALDALIENAVQHTAERGLIEIGAVVQAETLCIRVRDGGDGIPAEACARVFERFYRVDGGRSRRHGGVGLGLAIVKAIAEAHRGGVSVRSSPGAGSTFELRLPAAPSAGNEPVPAAADGLDHSLGLELAP